MARWSELKPVEKRFLIAFIVIVLLIFIMAWYGYFTGAWEHDPTEGYNHAN